MTAPVDGATGFLEEAVARTGRRYGCKLGDLLEAMPPDLRADVEAALALDHISNKAIAEALSNRGYPLAEDSVRRHRGGCRRCG